MSARPQGVVNALVLLGLLSLSAACWREELGRPYRLSSGRSIRLMSVGIPPDSRSEWALQYQISSEVIGGLTKRALDKEADDERYIRELRKEIAEIWRHFQQDVQKAKVARATIVGYTGGTFPLGEPRLGNELFGRTVNVHFTRSADGTWSDSFGVLNRKLRER